MSTPDSSATAQPVEQTSAATGTQPVIPYRAATPVPAGSMAVALAITVLVLVALIAGIAYARRRGWMTGTGVERRAASEPGIEVRASRRISMATTAHVVAYRGIEYFVVESGRGCVATLTPLDASSNGRSNTP